MSTMPCSQKNCKQINGADYKLGFFWMGTEDYQTPIKD